MDGEWYKLDNVAKVFLATYNKRDPRSIRVSCTLKEDIDKEALQRALDETMAVRPQFQVRIRRGFFWHYMEQTDVMPKVTEEENLPCPLLYGQSYRGILHLKVSYYGRRINADMFHAISDGTGALSFLKLLVLNYLKIVHPGELDDVALLDEASADDMYQNSFEHFYESTKGSAAGGILNKKKKAYQIQGRKLNYNQTRFFEVHLEADKLLAASKACKVSLTSYLGALLMMTIHESMPASAAKRPVTISMPVNLRNYYPSKTLRNFFNSVDLSHVFTGDETVENLAAKFDAALKESIKPDRIAKQMNNYESMERVLFTRMVPLAIKQPIVRLFTKRQGRTVTAVLSNLGPVKVPEKMGGYINGFTDFCSTEKLFITVTSYGNDLVLGIASAYAGTGIIRRLVQKIKETGTGVMIYASEVIRL